MIDKKTLQENAQKAKSDTKAALQTMLDAFTTATNWSTYANQFEIGGKFGEVL